MSCRIQTFRIQKHALLPNTLPNTITNFSRKHRYPHQYPQELHLRPYKVINGNRIYVRLPTHTPSVEEGLKSHFTGPCYEDTYATQQTITHTHTVGANV